jgi:hypothetical protein
VLLSGVRERCSVTVTLAASKFAEAKDMLRWILDQEKQERQAAPALAAQASAAS